MRYFKNCVVIVIFLLGINASLISQVLIGPALGVSIPSGDYNGTTSEFYSGTSYGLSGGVCFGALLKAKLSFVNLRVTFNYSSLSNSGNAAPSNGTISIKHNLFIIGAGPEFSFGVPASNVKPYFGLNILFTSFSGETTFQDVSRVPTGTYSMASTTRAGLGLDIGSQFDLGSKYAIDLNFQYGFLNLFGKSFNGGTSRIYSYTSLNDAQDPLFSTNPENHPIGSSRMISLFQLTIGFLFGL